MSTYVLIHGSWHGAWCWYKLAPRLERAGHRVIAPDLPGPNGQRAFSEMSLQTWAGSVSRILDAQPEPAILVGHSRGGIVISQAAEYRPEKVRALVYLAGFLVPDGASLMDVAHTMGAASVIASNLVIDEAQGTHTVRAEALREGLYGDCSDEDVALARSLHSPEPVAPGTTPLRLTEAKYGRIPRVYVHTLRDRCIPPATQEQMVAAQPCERVLTMDTSHAPLFSAPDELAAHLLALA